MGQGIGTVDSKGQEIILAGGLMDENSLDEPTKVASVSRDIDGLSTKFTYTFRPYSLTVLRLTEAH